MKAHCYCYLLLFIKRKHAAEIYKYHKINLFSSRLHQTVGVLISEAIQT